MDELISRICLAAGLDEAKASHAVVAILSFLRKDGPPAEVDQLFAAIPGAEAAAASNAAAPDSGAGGLMGMFGGGGGGGLMGLAGELSGLGLGMGDMQTIGKELFAYAREKAGDDVVGRIAGSIPGLSQFI